MHKVTFIPGDGVGPEVAYAARECVEATGVKFEWVEMVAGEGALKKSGMSFAKGFGTPNDTPSEALAQEGTPLPEEVLDSIKKNKFAWKGPITTPVGKGFRSVNVALRQELDLFCCLRPCKLYPGVPSRYKDIDLVVVRENSEDLYAGIEFKVDSTGAKELIELVKQHTGKKILPGSAISIKPISSRATERIVRFAFEYARKHNRKKVTAVHKANIMKFSDGLFLETAAKVAKDYAEIEFEDRIVDNMCMQLVQKPQIYDVMVLPNLYGDIISDLCAGLVGGLGMSPGANLGDDIAVFEPTHGSAPKYTGQNKVNPCGMILSGAMLLSALGETEAAERLESAVASVLKEGKTLTYDLGGKATTQQVAEAVIGQLKKA